MKLTHISLCSVVGIQKYKIISLVNEGKHSSKYETLQFSMSLCLPYVNIGLYTVHKPLANQSNEEIKIAMRIDF